MSDAVKIEQKTKSSTMWSSITEICSRLVAPIVSMVLARLLTPEAFGIIATVNMVISFADMFTDAGFNKYLVQHDFKEKAEFFKYSDVAFWANLFISLSGWLLIFIFSEDIATLVGNPGLGNVVCVAAISLPITSFSSIQSAHYRKSFGFKQLFFIRLIVAFIPLVVTVPIAYITRSYWAMIIGSLVSNLSSAVLMTIYSKWKPRLFFNFSYLKDMFSYSWWILIESIVIWLTSYIGTFIVGRYLTQTDVGYYKTAMTTVNHILSLVTTATSAPLFSGLSAIKNERKEFENLYYKFIRAVGCFLIPIGVGLFVFRKLATSILLGSQWLLIADFVGLWALVNVFSIVWGTYCNGIFNALGKPYLSVVSQLSQLVVLIPAIVLGCQSGFEVLYKARSLVRLELIVVQFILVKFFIKMSPSKYIYQSWKTIVCTAIMALLGYVITLVSDNLIIQFFGVLLCVLVYFAIYSGLFKKDLLEAFDTIGINLTSIKRRLFLRNRNKQTQ